MLRNIFCGCTSNKNIQNDVIELDIKDDINTEKETELELLEKEEEEINKDSPELDSPELEAMQNTKEKFIQEEDEEIIDILTQKPVEKAEESKTISRKYLFFLNIFF